MSNFWSDCIQTSQDLYDDRFMRFRDDNKDKWLSAMNLSDGLNVLDVGCGGGSIISRIKQFLSRCTVTGLDYDEHHIEFAKAKSAELGLDCSFVVGDGLNLPFADDSFDRCISHTVIEHVEPNRFLSEQYRVLKPGGMIAVMNVRRGIGSMSNTSGEEEQALLDKLWKDGKAFDREHGVAKFHHTESEIPAYLEKAGFTNVSVDFMAIKYYLPDNPMNELENAKAQVELHRREALNGIEKIKRRQQYTLTNSEELRLAELINARFDNRIQQLVNGDKQWDMYVGIVMTVTGWKL